jgi:uncharacterized iron-regulated membrane protein
MSARDCRSEIKRQLHGERQSISGPVMWLKRRKSGLGAPEPDRGQGVVWSIAVLLIVLGIVFPSLG